MSAKFLDLGRELFELVQFDNEVAIRELLERNKSTKHNFINWQNNSFTQVG